MDDPETRRPSEHIVDIDGDLDIERIRNQLRRMPNGGGMHVDSRVMTRILYGRQAALNRDAESSRLLDIERRNNRRLHEEIADLFATNSSQKSEIDRLTEELARAIDERNRVFGSAVTVIEEFADSETTGDLDPGIRTVGHADPNTQI